MLAREKHYFYGSGLASLFKFFTGVPSREFYPPWTDGREYQTEALDTSGNVLRRRVNTWQQPIGGTTWPLTQAETNNYAKLNDPQVTQTVSTLADTNQVAQQSFGYDQYLNQTDIYEYDFGAGAPGALVRRLHTDYLSSGSYTEALAGAHIRNLPTQQWVSTDAAGSNRASLVTTPTTSMGSPTAPAS